MSYGTSPAWRLSDPAIIRYAKTLIAAGKLEDAKAFAKACGEADLASVWIYDLAGEKEKALVGYETLSKSEVECDVKSAYSLRITDLLIQKK